jgi:hypothetical protein
MRTRTISSQSLLESPLAGRASQVEGFRAPLNQPQTSSLRFLWGCALFLSLQAGLILSRLVSQLPR